MKGETVRQRVDQNGSWLLQIHEYIVCLYIVPFLLFLEECDSVETSCDSVETRYVFRVFWEEPDIKNLNFNLHFPKVSEDSHRSTI